MERTLSQDAVFSLIVKSNVDGLESLSKIEREMFDALSASCDIEALGEQGPYTGVDPDDPVVRFIITACVGKRN